jgi:ATP-binding cassette subfamily C (CFTR/MRP) protein 1
MKSLAAFEILANHDTADDRILVMDAVRCVEFDDPLVLYDRGGIFHGMCASSGISRADICSQREHIKNTV